MVAQEPQATLYDLIEAACENRLSAENAAQLERILTNDRAARRTYLTCIHAQSLLERFDAARPDHVPPAAGDGGTGDEPAIDEGAADEAAAVCPRFSLRRLSGALADYREHPERVSLAVAATVVLAMVAILAVLRPSWLELGGNVAQQQVCPASEVLSVAMLETTADAVWKGDKPSRKRPRLRAGQRLQLAAGLAKIVFDQGSEVILEGPADFVVQQTNAGRCNRGRLVARVPDRAVGFTVETEAATITDLGTEFGVAVDETGTVDISVFDGLVEITRVLQDGTTADIEPRVLVEGEQIRVFDGQLEAVADAGTLRFTRQMPATAETDAPDGLVGYWDFDSLRGNLVIDRSGYSGSAVPRPKNLLPELVPGRFGKALKSGEPFEGLRIRNRVPPRFTLSLWVKTSMDIPQGDLAFHGVGLLWADMPGDHNDFVLTLLNDHVWFHDGATASLLPTRSFVVGTSKINDGRWHHIAVVRQGEGDGQIDEAGLRLYVDGRLEAAGLSGIDPLRDCPVISVGFNPNVEAHHYNRPLDGLIDDLTIFGRALSEEELEQLAQGEQPAGMLFGTREKEKTNGNAKRTQYHVNP